MGDVRTLYVPISVRALNETEVLLVDFEYVDNGDGTYIIVDWKQTYNGEPSTKIVIPDDPNIIL